MSHAAESAPRRRLGPFVRRYPLAAFFALAFIITWAPTPFGVFMAAGPLLAALVITAVVDGRQGLRDLGGRLLRWRVGWRWYAAALLIPLAVVLGTGALNVALGASGSGISELELPSLALFFALRLVVPVFSPLGEEPGWRGFALARLLADRSPLEATLFLGLIVAVWHVPLIFIAEEDLPPIFLLTTVAVTFFYSWLFIHTGGSVFITILAHAAEGTIGREFTGANGFVGPDKTHWILLYTAGWCAVAIGLIVFDRQFRRGRRRVPIDWEATPALAEVRHRNGVDGRRTTHNGPFDSQPRRSVGFADAARARRGDRCPRGAGVCRRARALLHDRPHGPRRDQTSRPRRRDGLRRQG